VTREKVLFGRSTAGFRADADVLPTSPTSEASEASEDPSAAPAAADLGDVAEQLSPEGRFRAAVANALASARAGVDRGSAAHEAALQAEGRKRQHLVHLTGAWGSA
jgi:hypothetical protein